MDRRDALKVMGTGLAAMLSLFKQFLKVQGRYVSR